MKRPDIFLLPMLLAENTHQIVLTPYALESLKTLKVFFVENIKTTRRFISSLKAGIVIDDLQFIEINQNSDFEELFVILNELDQDAGIISEAGCAGVADPGALVVEVAHQLGLQVKPLVGPNSILLALMASGFNGQSFAFNGYLPIKDDERAKKLRALEREALQKKQTQIFMETPYRNNQMLTAIVNNLNPNTRLCIAADITSETEFIKTQSIESWKRKGLPDLNKRPAIFLIY
ncbi:SAM-dependent methyltransferase [Lacihabitans sp. CS3-21]|jgi:16S rRNA (cytidine1402-2'-O)-methyltransferase|uniref:SAM-dependent methyltransferase n=1 Tax=Lacihabitans sp. CS3-21 TaxID=2487332 RepID=UPI0020CF7EDF|nr:SAM-dependent methyltransferase [Lacihabitans sp. CS3-21]MCP9746734.1 SAM-dependent methyltransferase [Lacihabitans sp. CS3-21]MDP1814145.1 SAM-dependent methyltransferase [Leadbetterella sp.]